MLPGEGAEPVFSPKSTLANAMAKAAVEAAAARKRLCKRFFSVVFGADTSRTLTEVELIGFGAPTAKGAAMGLDRF